MIEGRTGDRWDSSFLVVISDLKKIKQSKKIICLFFIKEPRYDMFMTTWNIVEILFNLKQI